MKKTSNRPLIAYVMSALLVCTGLFSSFASAGMMQTSDIIHYEQTGYDKETLLVLLDSEELKQQLIDLGVDYQLVEERVESMTADEIASLNEQLQEAPAGGIVGAIVTVFIVLVVTDMLCATDVFSFVKCINN